MNETYEVVAGNVGTVYRGNNYKEADAAFAQYSGLSKSGRGRCGGEVITLFEHGELVDEFEPEQEVS